MSVVFLCVGAAKAGTSWLHTQLQAHPECHFRSIKELHYFDALDGKGLALEREKHLAEQARVEAWAGAEPNERQAMVSRFFNSADRLLYSRDASDLDDQQLRQACSAAVATCDRRLISKVIPSPALAQ